MKLHEMTLAAGNLRPISDNFLSAHKEFFLSSKIVDVLDGMNVRKTEFNKETFFIFEKDTDVLFVAGTTSSPDNNIADIEVSRVSTNKNYYRKGMFTKFLNLMVNLGFTKILLGDVHGKDMQDILKFGLSDFSKTWINLKTKQTDDFAKVSHYQFNAPSDWRVLLELK